MSLNNVTETKRDVKRLVYYDFVTDRFWEYEPWLFGVGMAYLHEELDPFTVYPTHMIFENSIKICDL